LSPTSSAGLDRAGDRPEIGFMRLSSDGLATESSGRVHLLDNVEIDLAGRRVLLVEDIVDSGRSIAFAADLLRQPEVEAKVDFVGFSIGDVFVAGYGTDHGEKYRLSPISASSNCPSRRRVASAV
jgi:hypoxanthine phosphoribosyltransferase